MANASKPAAQNNGQLVQLVQGSTSSAPQTPNNPYPVTSILVSGLRRSIFDDVFVNANALTMQRFQEWEDVDASSHVQQLSSKGHVFPRSDVKSAKDSRRVCLAGIFIVH